MPGLVQRRLFTDGSALVLAGVPEVVMGQPMRLLLAVPEEFLDRPAAQAGTPMVTTAVTEVSRLAKWLHMEQAFPGFLDSVIAGRLRPTRTPATAPR